jgi:hypothetical protein
MPDFGRVVLVKQTTAEHGHLWFIRARPWLHSHVLGTGQPREPMPINCSQAVQKSSPGAVHPKKNAACYRSPFPLSTSDFVGFVSAPLRYKGGGGGVSPRATRSRRCRLLPDSRFQSLGHRMTGSGLDLEPETEVTWSWSCAWRAVHEQIARSTK